MAEAFFNTGAAGDKILSSEFSSKSAGTATVNGLPASENSIIVLNNSWGINLSNHRSRSLDQHMLEDAFLILTMTRSHKISIVRAFPHLASRVATLKEYVGSNEGTDISDPYGMDADSYLNCAHEIKTAVNALIAKLKNYYN